MQLAETEKKNATYGELKGHWEDVTLKIGPKPGMFAQGHKRSQSPADRQR